VKNTKGTATFGEKTNTDICYSETMVVEYYCSSGSIQYSTVSCGTGYVCSDGACITSDCKEDEESLDEDYENWYAFKTASSLKMYVGERAQIYTKYTIGLESVDTDSATLTLYDADGDDLCTDSIDDGDTVSKFCSKSGVSVEVDSVTNDTSATIQGDLAYLQVYKQEGTSLTYTGTTCTETDSYDVETETSVFYPRLTSGAVMLLGTKYTVSAVDLDASSATIKNIDGGETKEIEEGDEVEIGGNDYTFTALEFSEYGLIGWTVEQS
jgi:hypothetical protein